MKHDDRRLQLPVSSPSTPLADHLAAVRLVEARSLRGEQTRIRILEAAMAVFSRLGYELTSVDDIAREAGISRPGFYAYFPNKFSATEALADCVGIFILKDLEDLAALGPELTTAGLAAWVERRLATTAQHADYMRIFRHVAAVEPAFAARTRARYAAEFPRLGRTFPVFARAASDPAGSDALLAQLYLAQLDQICVDLIMGWDVDRGEIARLFAARFREFLIDRNPTVE